MRVGNLAHRLVLFVGNGVVDVEAASGGRFGPDPQAVYPHWDEFRHWYAGATFERVSAYDQSQLGAPAPQPSQIFAIGLNYRDHANESGFGVQEQPAVFTKFRSAITGAYKDIDLPMGNVDWEAELVVVMGKECRRVSTENAWAHVAGLTAGQDLSEREMQMAGTAPQFSLAKSFPGFAAMGPSLVTIDELKDPDDLALGCSVNGEEVQKSRTSLLLFSVSELIAYLSSVLTLQPGDVIYTGTPAGVGVSREPPRFLKPRDELVSYVEGIGEMHHRFLPS